MPQSLAHLLVHLVLSTKDREPFLTPAIRSSLHAYLAEVARNAGCGSYWRRLRPREFGDYALADGLRCDARRNREDVVIEMDQAAIAVLGRVRVATWRWRFLRRAIGSRRVVWD